MPNLAGDPYAGARSRPPPGDVNTGVVLYAFDLRVVRRLRFNAAIGAGIAEGVADTAGDGM